MAHGAGNSSLGETMGRITWALGLVILLATAAPAPAATLVSETTWGGPASEVVGDAAVAPDGSTYVAGFTTSFGTSTPTIFVIKFAAADGSLSWQRTWEAPVQFGTDQANDVAVAADGSVYVTGSTQGDAVLLKLSSDGELLWQRRWGGSGNESGEAVAVAGDGSIYVVGGTSSFGSHLFVLKFAPDGALAWQKIREGGTAQGVAVRADGTIAVAGVAGRAEVPGEFDVVVLTLTDAGALVWQRAYSAAEVADARGGVAVGADGSIHVAGAIQASGRKVIVDALLVKFAPDGSLVWDRAWGGRSGDVSSGVAVAADGTALWSGDSNSYGVGSDDAFLLHMSADGRAIDSNTWGGPGIDHGDGVAVGPTGTISLAATAETAPFSFLGAPAKTSRPRGIVTTPTAPLADASGAVADPGGTLSDPAGTSPGPDNSTLRS
jgi:uncharacterized delta-60 repeat protein